jgi:hypothetical protein
MTLAPAIASSVADDAGDAPVVTLGQRGQAPPRARTRTPTQRR